MQWRKKIKFRKINGFNVSGSCIIKIIGSKERPDCNVRIWFLFPSKCMLLTTLILTNNIWNYKLHSTFNTVLFSKLNWLTWTSQKWWIKIVIFIV